MLEPPATKVFVPIGVDPVEIALSFLVYIQEKAPGPVACRAVCETHRYACKRMAFLPLVSGFQSPMIGVAVPSVVAVVNVAALMDVESMPPV
jgi:hypothetical protein